MNDKAFRKDERTQFVFYCCPYCVYFFSYGRYCRKFTYWINRYSEAVSPSMGRYFTIGKRCFLLYWTLFFTYYKREHKITLFKIMPFMHLPILNYRPTMKKQAALYLGMLFNHRRLQPKAVNVSSHPVCSPYMLLNVLNCCQLCISITVQYCQ